MVTTDRKRVLEAFKALRKAGIVARAAFMCCGSCASAAMPEDKLNVYWHKQADDRSFTERRRGGWRKSDRVRVEHVVTSLMFGFNDKLAAQALVVALKAQGFGERVQWTGEDFRCVELLPSFATL